MTAHWPRLRSFRLRIALGSTLTALAAIVLLYAMASYTIIHRRADIIDRMLSAHLAGPGFQATPLALWPATDAQLNASFSGFAPAASGPETYALLLVEDAGKGPLYRSPAWQRWLGGAELPRGPGLHTVDGAGQSWRIGSAVQGSVTIWVAVNRSLSDAQVRASLTRFAAAIGVLAVAMGALAWYLAGRAMRPVEHLTGVMVGLTASELDQRVSAAEEDLEFAQMISVYNAMLERLQRSFLQSARFSGDAAHELRTPLTILQGELERSFARASAAADPVLEEGLANMLDEVRRLDSIVRKLLLLARADAGQLAIPPCPLDLRPTLDELAEDIGLLDAERPSAWTCPNASPCAATPTCCARCCKTWSAMPSSTGCRAAGSRCRSGARASNGGSTLPMPRTALLQSIATACSTASTGPTTPTSAASTASGWVCRWRATSPWPTAAASPWPRRSRAWCVSA